MCIYILTSVKRYELTLLRGQNFQKSLYIVALCNNLNHDKITLPPSLILV
jgi:hypothetical protein